MSQPRLFTARYANKALAEHPAAKVRITLGAPRFRLPYQLAGSILELAPTRSMFGMSERDFARLYRRLLQRRGGVEFFAERITQIVADDGF